MVKIELQIKIMHPFIPLFLYTLIGSAIVGAIIAIINKDEVNTFTEKIESWARTSKATAQVKIGRWNRFVSRPFFWLLVKFSDWTDSLAHRGLKNGIRVAATISLVCLTIGLVVTSFVVVISLIVLWFMFKMVFAMIGVTDDEPSPNRRRVVGNAGNNQRINPDTGEIEENGLFGWTKTGKRINPDSGDIEEDGLFGYSKTGTRVDQETGRVQKEDWLVGHTNTDTRIHPETGVIQKDGLLGWTDTDERINPETGRKQTKDFLGGWMDKS